jgi:hypothetical protein
LSQLDFKTESCALVISYEYLWHSFN